MDVTALVFDTKLFRSRFEASEKWRGGLTAVLKCEQDALIMTVTDTADVGY